MTARLTPRQPMDTLPVYELHTIRPLLHRLRCGTCGGQVHLSPPDTLPGYLYCTSCAREWNAVVDRLAVQRPLPPAETPKRGRPPKGGALCRGCALVPATPGRGGSPYCGACRRQRQKTGTSRRRATAICAVCGVTPITPWRTRCRPCAKRQRAETTTYTRLLGLLASGQTVGRHDLIAALGVASTSFQHAVQTARRHGHRVVNERGHGYRLVPSEEVAS